MQRLFALLIAATLAGCASYRFENRLACTADGQHAVYISYYGPIGLASKISAEDAGAACGGLRSR